MYSLIRFLRGIFGYAEARAEQEDIKKELKQEAAMARAIGGEAKSSLSRLEREMRAVEQEKDE